MEDEAFGTTVHFLPFSCSKLLKSLSGVIAGDCGYLTAPAGVDLVLELSRVNALLPRRTDGVFPRVLHLQRTTSLARLKLANRLLRFLAQNIPAILGIQFLKISYNDPKIPKRRLT